MPWFPIDLIRKKKLCSPRFAVSFQKFLSSFIFSKKFVYKCITSILLLEQKAYNLIDDKWYVCQYMRTQKKYYQQGEKYDENQKLGTKMTRFPAPGFEPWPRTATWCSQMLYPLSCGELVNFWGWISNSYVRCPPHCKNQAYKHRRYHRGRQESPFQWFAIDSTD